MITEELIIWSARAFLALWVLAAAWLVWNTL